MLHTRSLHALARVSGIVVNVGADIPTSEINSEVFFHFRLIFFGHSLVHTLLVGYVDPENIFSYIENT